MWRRPNPILRYFVWNLLHILQLCLIFHPFEGEILQEARPGFTSNPRNTLSMVDFEELYAESSNKIMNDFVKYNANGSGWILSRVQLISVHIHCYSPFNVNDDTNDTDDEDTY